MITASLGIENKALESVAGPIFVSYSLGSIRLIRGFEHLQSIFSDIHFTKHISELESGDSTIRF